MLEPACRETFKQLCINQPYAPTLAFRHHTANSVDVHPVYNTWKKQLIGSPVRSSFTEMYAEGVDGECVIYVRCPSFSRQNLYLLSCLKGQLPIHSDLTSLTANSGDNTHE